MSVSSPIYRNNEFKGVVAMDLVIEELFFFASSFRPNEFSYAFVMNNNGWYIIF